MTSSRRSLFAPYTTLWLAVFLCPSIRALATDSVPPTIEDYGQLPTIRDIEISPDGKHYAYIQRMADDKTLFAVVEIETQELVGAVRSSKQKARSIDFVTDRFVILRASETKKSAAVRGAWEQDYAVAYDLKTKKQRALPHRFDNLYFAQSGMGRIVGVTPSQDAVFMPAFTGQPGDDPEFDLLRVALESGRARTYRKGTRHTIDWFLRQDGAVLAREEFDNEEDVHRVQVPAGKSWRTIYEQQTDIPSIALLGSTPDGQALVFTGSSTEGASLFHLDLKTGAIAGPFLSQADREIERVLTRGVHGEYVGVQLSGPKPEYRFEGDSRDAPMQALLNSYPTSSLYPISETRDRSRSIVRVTGNDGAHDFLLYDKPSDALSLLARGYPRITPDYIAEIQAIRYPARDGTKIPAILTWPLGESERKNLPTLVFPHGGPESYDRIAFDWWAQYFASRGYLVLQPNFRGSSGYGAEYTRAGYGEWGRLMQDDVSDGLNALVRAGYADPERVCIMGASYGGYSALAGGAFTPDLYRCVIAVAGVSDLPQMLRDEVSDRGRDHWVVSYWERFIGDSKAKKALLKSVSPANAADRFQAPVLLIHGNDDTVVPLSQSVRMRRRLSRADKQVQLVKLKGEDHWLSRSSSRLATLRAIARFLNEHNPVSAAR
ncbi:MAG: S9 family peptidase [Pseudomonadota bacterium]